MDRWNRVGRVALNRLTRCLSASVGLVVFAFAGYLQLQADIGLSPWFSLNQGLANISPLTYGQASLFTSALFVCIDLLLREPIGLGTILNATVVGIFSDIFLATGLIPVQTKLQFQLPLLMLGILLSCVGQYLYMKPALSCGPRDALLVALGRRASKISIGKINLALITAAQILACLMGGPFGVGTFITIFCMGTFMDLVFRALRFEPRSLKHESLIQTIAALRNAWRDPV